jgi:hypothetical protein
MSSGQGGVHRGLVGYEPHLGGIEPLETLAHPLAPAGEVGLLVREEMRKGRHALDGCRRVEKDLDQPGKRVVFDNDHQRRDD